MPHAPRPFRLPRLHRLLKLATGNRAARGYLAVLAASVLAVFLFPEGGLDLIPLLLTAPLSFLAVVLPFGPGTEGGTAVEALAVGSWVAWLLVCALVNAAMLGGLTKGSVTATPPDVRASRPHVPHPSWREGADTARSAAPRPRGVRTLLAPAVDNWLARGYLAVVVASLGFFLYAAYLSQDPGFAGIWPLVTTAPLGIVASVLAAPVDWVPSFSWLSPLVFTTGTALSGLLNAVLIGRLAHRIRREPHAAA